LEVWWLNSKDYGECANVTRLPIILTVFMKLFKRKERMWQRTRATNGARGRRARVNDSDE